MKHKGPKSNAQKIINCTYNQRNAYKSNLLSMQTYW